MTTAFFFNHEYHLHGQTYLILLAMCVNRVDFNEVF